MSNNRRKTPINSRPTAPPQLVPKLEDSTETPDLPNNLVEIASGTPKQGAGVIHLDAATEGIVRAGHMETRAAQADLMRARAEFMAQQSTVFENSEAVIQQRTHMATLATAFLVSLDELMALSGVSRKTHVYSPDDHTIVPRPAE